MASAPPARPVSNANTGSGLKIPIFNTSSFRMPPMGSESSRPARLPLPTSTMIGNRVTPSNTTTTKISVGGKVIDVDVLTKLHQANRNGKVITFNASKDLLSNLAVKKLVGTKTINQINKPVDNSKVKPIIQQQQQQQQQQSMGKTISVTVFSTQGKKNQEKFLLPKTSQPFIEVKKFAPEMNGLLTALKTTSSTKKPMGQSVDEKNPMKGYTLQSRPILVPVNKDQHKKPMMLFPPSTTSVKSQYAPKSNMPLTITTYKPETVAITATSRSSIQQQQQRLHNNKKTAPPHFNKMNVITSYGNSNNTKPSATSKPISAIVENRAYKANKVMLENNKKANFKIKSMLLKDQMVKGSKDKAFTRIDGFEQLYNEAVNNVLKIETTNKKRNEIKDERTKNETLKEIEKEFQKYLDTPMEIEKKIEEGLFKFCRKRPSPSSSAGGTPNETKKRKLIDEEMLTAYLKSDSISPVFIKNSSTPPTVKVNDNRNFFEQFLTDRAKIPPPFTPLQPQPRYISPIEYPWFYPAYFYSNFHQSNQRGPHQCNNPPSKRVKSSTPTTPIGKEIKINTSPTQSVAEERERTIGVKTRSSSGLKEAKRNQPLSSKTIKDNNKNNENKELILTNINKKKSSFVDKVMLPMKNEKFASKNHLMKPKPKGAHRMSASEKRLHNKEKLKFRYSLRQRAKALKKAIKLSNLQQVNQPKLILKKFDQKTCTKKELFLAVFGLRRVLKRVPQNKEI